MIWAREERAKDRGMVNCMHSTGMNKTGLSLHYTCLLGVPEGSLFACSVPEGG